MDDIGITRHAKKRVKQRVGGNPEKLFREALEHGYRNTDFTGAFRRYLDRRQRELRGSVIVHKNKLYFIKGSTLITLYEIPTKFKKYKPKAKEENHGE